MAVYAIGDLHLSLGGNHSMEVFSGWEYYVEQIQYNWDRLVKPQDTVVLVGDTSWGMRLEEALPDFQFIEKLPGKKLLVKGNHDYWWTTKAKLDSFFSENGLKTMDILHNTAVAVDGIVLCGSRGWLPEPNVPHDEKIIQREVGRLRMSLEAGKKTGLEPVVFLHYPPIYAHTECTPMLETLVEYGIGRCYYGHIHHKGHNAARQGRYLNVDFTLVSSDYRRFSPVLVQANGV